MINYNVSPYFDDFDPTKNYHRILFKPGYAVQARELTQSQTILQNQISQFASSIFSQNTPVSGGKVTLNLNVNFIKLNPTYNNNSIVASDYVGSLITDGPTGVGITARVVAAAESTSTSTTAGDPPTLVVQYLSGTQFSDGMTLYVQTDTSTSPFATTIGSVGGTTSVGQSSVASISAGVFYVINGFNQLGNGNNFTIGNFVNVNPQTIILDKYDNQPSLRIGLGIVESTVTFSDDATLLDPATGSTNYQAPGADRYKIDLNLQTTTLSLGSNDASFIELMRVDKGTIIKQTDSTVYSAIDDYFAKRDYETNGDYIVNDFKLTPSASATAAQYDLSIGPGVAYVHGYRIENQSTLKLTGNRARTVANVATNIVPINYGNYFVVDSANGLATMDFTQFPLVDIHCVPSAYIAANNSPVAFANVASAAAYTANAYASTLVGTARLRNMTYLADGGSANVNTYVYQAYISDFQTNTLSGNATVSLTTYLSTPNTLVIFDPTNRFSNVGNAYINATLYTNLDSNPRNITAYQVYTTASGNAKIFTVNSATPFPVPPTNTTTFSIAFQSYDAESLVVKGGQFDFTANVNINAQYGKVGGYANNDAILTSTGEQEMIFQVGSQWVANVYNSSYQTTKVYRSTTLGTSSNVNWTLPAGSAFSSGASGLNVPLNTTISKQNFIVVDAANNRVMDFTSAGNTINVSVSGGVQTATFSSNYYNNVPITIYGKVQITSPGKTDSAVIKTKLLKVGNTSTVSTGFTAVAGQAGANVDLSLGQTLLLLPVTTAQTRISLYVSDIKKVTKIIDTGNPNTAPTNAMLTNASYDVTSLYKFYNNQQDSHYDHGYLIPLAGGPRGQLLVIYDYYQHGGGDGYFSVLSYLSTAEGGLSISPETYANIGSYTATSGYIYQLRDSIDFRPRRTDANTTFSLTFSNSDTKTKGYLTPQHGTSFQSSYNYYLGRKDLLVLSKDKSFQIIEGAPSTTPIPPGQPDGSLLLANMTHDPYTTLVPGENTPDMQASLSINKVPHNRWAKSDISALQSRINNLEYYTSLSLLEQNATNMQVPDVNGLNRFKYGILVDNFDSFASADTANPDYAANINIRKQMLTPVTPVSSFQLQNPQVLASLGTLQNTSTFAVSSVHGTSTNIFTLPYTVANVVVQPLASNTVSLNPLGVAVYQGVAQLVPPLDNWVDTFKSPSVTINDPNLQIYQTNGGINATNSADFATLQATKVVDTTVKSATAIGNGTDTTSYNPSTAAYTPVSSALNMTNGYLTNVSMLPYIRPQQIGIIAKGMLVNTPVGVYFDGQDVSKYITTPDTIELSSVTGTFGESDVIGFYNSNLGKFIPTARVLGSYVYPANTSNVRLYVSLVNGSPNYSDTGLIQNANFDQYGNYIQNSNTAKGVINQTTSMSTQGIITGVGSIALPTNTTTYLYKVHYPQLWSSFMNQYGVWGNLNQTSTFTLNTKWTPTSNGVYNVSAQSTGTSTTITANGVVLFSGALGYSSATPQKTTITIAAANVGNPVAINVSVVGATSYQSGISVSEPGVAFTIEQGGTIVLRSDVPPLTTYSNVASIQNFTNGGTYFYNATSVQLDAKASNVSGYYVGGKLKVQSKLVYDVVQQTATYSAAYYVYSRDGDSAWLVPAKISYATK